MNRNSRGIGIYFLTIAIVLLLLYAFRGGWSDTQTITQQEYSEEMTGDKIARADIYQNSQVPTGRVELTLTDGSRQQLNVSDVNTAQTELSDAGVTTYLHDVEQTSIFMTSILPTLIMAVVVIFLFMMMTAVGSYQIITRYFFNRPSTVSEELLTYSFTWMSLLASAYVFGKRDHMRMGFMADKLTGNFRKYLEIIIDLLSFSFAAVVMVYGGCSITKLTMIQTTASLRVPMGYIYVIVPVSGILIMIFAAMNAVEMFHHEFKEAGEVRV